MNRRHFINTSTIGLASTGLNVNFSPLHIVVAGAHPDDPETGCGGAIAKWAAMGHQVTLLYLTKGEAGIGQKTRTEAAAIREKEAINACKILGAQAQFFGQIDGDTLVNSTEYTKAKKILLNLKPDILLNHWPLDTHRDHRACALLFYDAWLSLEKPCALYYYEVMTGIQSQNFTPTSYVDISKNLKQKHQAVFAHKSQNLEKDYPNDHGRMELFRGMEAGFHYAEAFAKHPHSVAWTFD
jgi:LmbE family N-acetylglucosaminyl deacetylase